ncbi:MAG: MFS transporter [Chloroflexota bacterium]
MQSHSKRVAGMPALALICFGQLISLLGTQLTQFAVAIWVWQVSGSATALGIIAACTYAPMVLVSPFAGSLADRWSRKTVMLLSDLMAGLSTLLLVFLYATEQLAIWHLGVAGLLAGTAQAFQWPAYAAAISTMVNKEQYGRANGMVSLAEGASVAIAPLLAATLLGFVGIQGIMLIDIATFLFALLTLSIVYIPRIQHIPEKEDAPDSFWRDSVYGLRFVMRHPSLLGLLLIFLGMNLVASLSGILLTPMVLARTGDNVQILGVVSSSAGLGAVVGGILMSIWGGPKSRIHGVLLGCIVSSLFMPGMLGIGNSPIVWAMALFLGFAISPIITGSSQAIWQIKVAPAIQGRVFAARRMIAALSVPIAQLAAGPLADYVFEPAMRPEGLLAPIFDGIVGTGVGAGMAVIMLLMGVLGVMIGLVGYLIPAIRNVETILPDHDYDVDSERTAVQHANAQA